MIFFKGFNQWDFVPLGPSLFPTLELINKILQGIFPIVLGAPWSDTVCHSRSTPPKIQGFTQWAFVTLGMRLFPSLKVLHFFLKVFTQCILQTKEQSNNQ